MSLQIRNGDTVLVRVKVNDDYVDFGDTFLCKDAVGDTCEFNRSDIVSVEPRALRVGDRVKSQYYDGEIVAIHDKAAWIAVGRNHHETVPLTRLTLLAP